MLKYNIFFKFKTYKRGTPKRATRNSRTIEPSAFFVHRSLGEGGPPSANSRMHSTFDIIHAAESAALPDKIMITVHSQRWDNRPLPWVKELAWQNIKNVGKRFLSR